MSESRYKSKNDAAQLKQELKQEGSTRPAHTPTPAPTGTAQSDQSQPGVTLGTVHGAVVCLSSSIRCALQLRVGENEAGWGLAGFEAESGIARNTPADGERTQVLHLVSAAAGCGVVMAPGQVANKYSLL